MHGKLQTSDRSFTSISIKSQAQALAKFFQKAVPEAVIYRRLHVTEGWLSGFYVPYIQLWKLHLGLNTIYALLEVLFWEQNSIKTTKMELWSGRGTIGEVRHSFMTEQLWSSSVTWILLTLGLNQTRAQWITTFETGYRQGWYNYRLNYKLLSCICPSITFNLFHQ